jgi:hypothetical protein
MSHRTLKKTFLEKQADFTKDEAPGLDLDLPKLLEDKVKTDTKEGSALARSTRIRKASEFLPEDAVKLRKSYYCAEKTG